MAELLLYAGTFRKSIRSVKVLRYDLTMLHYVLAVVRGLLRKVRNLSCCFLLRPAVSGLLGRISHELRPLLLGSPQLLDPCLLHFSHAVASGLIFAADESSEMVDGFCVARDTDTASAFQGNQED